MWREEKNKKTGWESGTRGVESTLERESNSKIFNVC